MAKATTKKTAAKKLPAVTNATRKTAKAATRKPVTAKAPTASRKTVAAASKTKSAGKSKR